MFPPLKSVDQTNLPVQPTPFVGRERVADVLALLDSHRIVTLTGPGGSGKTRLALQAAAESVERYGDGVWFVSLAAVRDPQLIEPTIARVVGGPTTCTSSSRASGRCSCSTISSSFSRTPPTSLSGSMRASSPRAEAG